MPIDMTAIKEMLENLNNRGSKKGSNGGSLKKDTWSPKEGVQYEVRILPLENFKTPFKEHIYYQNIGKYRTLTALKNLGLEDPIADFRSKLYQEGTDSTKAFAKKLWPKTRYYAPVIVRGEEGEGVRWWGFGSTVMQFILSQFSDKDYGDITDISEGFDIKIKMIKESGADRTKPLISMKPKASPLSKDAKLVKEWMESIPNFDNIAFIKAKTTDEMDKILKDWLSSNTDEPSLSSMTDGKESAPGKNKESSIGATTLENVDDAFDAIAKDMKDEE